MIVHASMTIWVSLRCLYMLAISLDGFRAMVRSCVLCKRKSDKGSSSVFEIVFYFIFSI